MSVQEIQQKLQEKYNQKLCENSTEGHLFETVFSSGLYFSQMVCIKCNYTDNFVINISSSGTFDSYNLTLANDTSVIDFNDDDDDDV
jgi:hypothetical protein